MMSDFDRAEIIRKIATISVITLFLGIGLLIAGLIRESWNTLILGVIVFVPSLVIVRSYIKWTA